MRSAATYPLLALLALGPAACSDGNATGPLPPPAVASVAVAPDTATLMVGGSRALAATARAADGRALSGRAFAWSSSDSGVARVGPTGEVTAVAVGSAVIRASSEGKAGEARVQVLPVPHPAPTIQALTPASVAERGPGFTLSIAGSGFVAGARVHWNGVLRPTTFVSASELRAQIAPEDVAAVGTAEVRVINPSPGGGPSNPLSFQVVRQTNPVASVRVRPSLSITRVGSPVPLAALLRGAGGDTLAGRYILWTSSDHRVATVDGGGLVTAVGEGDAVIQATSEGRFATATITVSSTAAYHLLLDRDDGGLASLDMRLGDAPAVFWNQSPTYTAREPSPAPGGRRIAFTHTLGLALLDVAERTYRFLPTSARGSQPAWSPVDDRIAFRGEHAGRADVFTIGADGTGLLNLTAELPAGTQAEQPAWSPDGSRLAFALRGAGGRTDLWVMNADGSGKRMLTRGEQGDTEPSWHGDQIVFSRTGSPEENGLWRISADGTAARQLTPSLPGQAMQPTWSPEGRWIAFVVRDGATGRGDLLAIRADGSEIRPLSLRADGEAGGGLNPVWW